MTGIFTLLLIYVFGLTLSLFYSVIGEIFVVDTSTIILSIAGIIEFLIAATFWFNARKNEIAAWRTMWLACAILCIAYGWFALPKIYEKELMKKAVTTSIQMEGVTGAYPSPKTDKEKQWVLENKQKAIQADLRLQYYGSTKTGKNNWRSIINFGVGFLCLLCVFCARPMIDKLERNT